MKESVRKRDYLYRYGSYWIDFILRAVVPIFVIIHQFGFYKQELGLFSMITGSTMIGLMIGFWIAKDEILEFIMSLENKAWYKSTKRALGWFIAFGIVLFLQHWINQVLWVIGSFAFGSLPSVYLSSRNYKYRKKILTSKGKWVEPTIKDIDNKKDK